MIGILVCLSLFVAMVSHSQTCLPEGITFTTQSQVDSFQINYPGCAEIEGDVIIEGSGINNLSPLIVITNIEGFLQIGSYDVGNNSLKDLTGFDSLVSIGSDLIIVSNQRLNNLSGLRGITSIAGYLRILGNDSLENLIGLENISNVGGYFHIWYNDNLYNTSGLESLIVVEGGFSIVVNNKLKNLVGLENLVSIGGEFYLWYNDSLDCFAGLENLDSIHGNFNVSDNLNLTSLSGLNNLTSIGEWVNISGNYMLENLSGMQNLTSIGGDLSIRGNSNLVSLLGLDNINHNTISNLSIKNNAILTTCEAQSVCDYLASPNGTTEIHDNASGCNSQLEVEEACTVGTPEVQSERIITIFPNPTTSEITISGIEGTIDEISIYNRLGQEVIHKETTDNTIDVSWLLQGLYIVEVLWDGHWVREKLIVQ